MPTENAPAPETSDAAPANGAEADVPAATKPEKDQEDQKKEKKKFSSKKGIETMFRTSYRTNMDLSSLADAKANIMISINGLIVSILLASISPGIEKNVWLRWPTVILLVGCLTSLVFAVLAARPRVQSKAVTLEQVRRGAANLLFFGNFAHLSRDEFMEGMNELMIDKAAVYDNMVMDIYGLGLVLQKKYRLLRVAYTVFMVGLVVGVLAFIIVFLFIAPDVGSVTTTTPIPIVPAPSGGALP
ncbi:MAG: DUF5706 domain-containing protein [Rubricoccaceae bacterium]|nr:DUF5706 domain-containing protein [Rubricoccaceae bacterium]